MKVIKALSFFCFVFSLLSCPVNPPEVYRYGGYSASVNQVHVFFIGIDGWGSFSLPKADMPKVKEMMENGAYTLNTMNVLPTGSMPNWASMFYGAVPALHGFTHNTTKPTFPPAISDEYGYYPNIFAYIKRKVPNCRVAIFPEYTDLIKITPPQALDRAEEIASRDQAVLDYIDDLAANPSYPSFTFIQIDTADGKGHGWGFNSSVYYDELKEIDGYIKTIVDKAESDLTNTIFVLSADHGGLFYILNDNYSGIFFQHGGNTPEERQVPLIFYGHDIKAGFGITGSVTICDIAPSIAALFGIGREEQPEPWIGRRLEEVLTP